jgi:hypothetical protein
MLFAEIKRHIAQYGLSGVIPDPLGIPAETPVSVLNAIVANFQSIGWTWIRVEIILDGPHHLLHFA